MAVHFSDSFSWAVCYPWMLPRVSRTWAVATKYIFWPFFNTLYLHLGNSLEKTDLGTSGIVDPAVPNMLYKSATPKLLLLFPCKSFVVDISETARPQLKRWRLKELLKVFWFNFTHLKREENVLKNLHYQTEHWGAMLPHQNTLACNASTKTVE